MDVSEHWLFCGLNNRGVVVPFQSCSVCVMNLKHIDVCAHSTHCPYNLSFTLHGIASPFRPPIHPPQINKNNAPEHIYDYFYYNARLHGHLLVQPMLS